jgi:LPXTG-motif cell wall-anchored protein
MLNFVLALHQAMVWLILIGAVAALALGGTWLYLRRRTLLPSENVVEPMPPPPSATADQIRQYFRYALIALAGLGVLQALFGGILFLLGARPAEPLHYVYGLIVLLAIPVAYAYSDQRQVRRDVIIMTIAIVAVLGAAIRAWMTGGH